MPACCSQPNGSSDDRGRNHGKAQRLKTLRGPYNHKRHTQERTENGHAGNSGDRAG